jgi:predicted metalloprotease
VAYGTRAHRYFGFRPYPDPVQYNDESRLDTSLVSDARSGGIGRGGIALGGGGLGIVGVIVVVLLNVLGGGGGSSSISDVLGQLGSAGSAPTADNAQISQECKTGADANTNFDCAIVADIDSIQSFWAGELPTLGAQYTPVNTVWFTGQVSTGCGAASSAAGPFYCPVDKLVYIDLSFYDDLKTQFGATGGLFVDAYVLAHEYGHHVQDLLGTEAKVKQGETGPTSGSVRLELQADCYAGVWANHASTVPDATGKPLISNITQEDFANALDTAGKIGDDYIQTQIEHQTFNAGSETHGTAAQRQKWLSTGYQSGDAKQCDTFSTSSL